MVMDPTTKSKFYEEKTNVYISLILYISTSIIAVSLYECLKNNFLRFLKNIYITKLAHNQWDNRKICNKARKQKIKVLKEGSTVKSCKYWH